MRVRERCPQTTIGSYQPLLAVYTTWLPRPEVLPDCLEQLSSLQPILLDTFGDTFENTRWRKVKHMQPVCIFSLHQLTTWTRGLFQIVLSNYVPCNQFDFCLLLDKQSEETQWREVIRMRPVDIPHQLTEPGGCSFRLSWAIPNLWILVRALSNESEAIYLCVDYRVIWDMDWYPWAFALYQLIIRSGR